MKVTCRAALLCANPAGGRVFALRRVGLRFVEDAPGCCCGAGQAATSDQQVCHFEMVAWKSIGCVLLQDHYLLLARRAALNSRFSTPAMKQTIKTQCSESRCNFLMWYFSVIISVS